MKRIQINYKPLDKSVDMSVISGSSIQHYNATAGEYVPDHTLVPLVIQPVVRISDPDKIIASGVKNSVLTDISWYENKVDASTLISSTNSNYTIDRTSVNDARGRITVKKNVPNDQQLLLIFTAVFLDTRTNKGLPVMGSIQLSVQEAVESSIRLMPSYPSGQRIYPTTGRAGLYIDCPLMSGSGELAEATYQWQIKSEGSYVTLTEGLNGITGVSTSKLWIPSTAMSKRTYVKTVAKFGAQTYVYEHTLFISYEPYEVSIVVPGDGDIAPGVDSIKVSAKVDTAMGKVANPGNYFKFEWYNQSNEKIGEGTEINIPKSMFTVDGFGIELKTSEGGSDVIINPPTETETVWLADFTGISADKKLITRNLTAQEILLLSPKHIKVDCLFNSNTENLLFYTYFNGYTRLIQLAVNGCYLFRKDSNGNKVWFAENLSMASSGRKKIDITFDDTIESEAGIAVTINGVPCTDKTYLTDYYDILTVGTNTKLEIGAEGGGKLIGVEIGEGTNVLFDSTGVALASSSVRIPMSVTSGNVSDIVKQQTINV